MGGAIVPAVIGTFIGGVLGGSGDDDGGESGSVPVDNSAQLELEKLKLEFEKEKNQKELELEKLKLEHDDKIKAFERENEEKRRLLNVSVKEYQDYKSKIIKDIDNVVNNSFYTNYNAFMKNNSRFIAEVSSQTEDLSIFKNERFSKDFVQMLRNNINKRQIPDNQILNGNEVNHLNILLLGQTGVGKSTLINAIMGEKVAKTGIGKAVTEGFHEYEKGLLRLIDSRGIELKNNSMENLKNKTIELISKYEKKNDPDKLLHCIWYCVTGDRFDDEKELIKKILQRYSDNKIPVIIVFTKAFRQQHAKRMMQEIKRLLCNSKINTIDIVAKREEEFNVEPRGVKELLKYSFSKLEEAVESSLFTALKNNVLFKYKDIYTQRFYGEIGKLIIPNGVISYNDILNKFQNNFISTIENIFFREKLPETIRNEINRFIKNDISVKIENLINLYNEKFINDNSNYLVKLILDKTNEIGKKYNVYIPNDGSMELERQLKQILLQKTKFKIDERICKDVLEAMLQEFWNCFGGKLLTENENNLEQITSWIGIAVETNLDSIKKNYIKELNKIMIKAHYEE